MKHPNDPLCTQVENLIPLYVGEGDLGPQQAALVREHLARCAGCAESTEAAVRARSALVALRDSSASDEPDLWKPIRAALASEGRLGGQFESRLGGQSVPARSIASKAAWRRTAALARWLPAAAAAAALFAFALVMGDRQEGAAPIPAAPVAVPRVASGDGGEAPASPFAGGLRRAFPWEERLRDSAQPFPAGFAPEAVHGVPLRATPPVTPVGWSLAGHR
jgi:hypothetical protein